MRTSLKIICALFILMVIAFLFIRTGFCCNSTTARTVATKVLIRVINTSLDEFKAELGVYPNPEHGLSNLVYECAIENWNGPYLPKKTIPKDYWDNPLHYEVINGIPIVISAGKDGKLGTFDDIETSYRYKLSEPAG